ETLNAIVADGKTDIQAFINQAKTDLTKVKDDATEDITTTANNAKTSVQDTADSSVNKINSTAEEATQHIDEKVTEFNQTVADNGFLSPEMLDEQLGELEWQKYKLTEDDGTRKTKSNIDILTLDTGFYEIWGCTNTPLNDTAVYNVIVFGKNGRKFILATHSYENRTFINTIHTNGDIRGWKELTNSQTDTGWIPFDLINGAKTNTAYTAEENPGFKCAYRIIKNGEETKKTVRINGTNLTHNQVIAQLPETFVKNAQAFPVRVPASDYSGYVVFKVSGEVTF